MSRLRRFLRAGCGVALLVGACIAPPDAMATGKERLPLLLVLRSPDLYVGVASSQPQLVGDNEVLFGCDPYEVEQDGMRRCLRFDTLVANLGTGPLELRYDGRGAISSMRAVQRIYETGGGHRDRPAGSFYWDTAHGHFHYAHFERAALWRATRAGHRVGTAPVRTGRKDGFCLEDLGPYSSNSAKKAYTFPDACYPTVQPDGSLTQVNGISAGWLDSYDETLTNQSIEITGVKDGYYLLQITVDPDHTLLLDPKSRTTSWQLIRLCGQQVDIVGRSHHCGHTHASNRPTMDKAKGHPAPRPLAWRSLCRGAPCPVIRLSAQFALPR